MQRLSLNPAVQNGHQCKIVAIAALDAYYAKLVGYQPFLVHKRYYQSSYGISLRQIAKLFGSQQGELLEIQQLHRILNYIGYAVVETNFQNNLEEFKSKVKTSIASGIPLLVFFAVNRQTGLPADYDENKGANEHAAIITGYNKISDEIELTHWENRYTTTLKNFFLSTMQLPEKRKPEFYKSVKMFNPALKYDLVKKNESHSNSKKSIIPLEKSGFRAKLLAVKLPQLNTMLQHRRTLSQKNLFHIIDYAISRIVKLAPSQKKSLVDSVNRLYKNQIQKAYQHFLTDNNYREFKNSVLNAEEHYLDSIASLDLFHMHYFFQLFFSNKNLDLAKNILKNLTFHILKVIATYEINHHRNSQQNKRFSNETKITLNGSLFDFQTSFDHWKVMYSFSNPLFSWWKNIPQGCGSLTKDIPWGNALREGNCCYTDAERTILNKLPQHEKEWLIQDASHHRVNEAIPESFLERAYKWYLAGTAKELDNPPVEEINYYKSALQDIKIYLASENPQRKAEAFFYQGLIQFRLGKIERDNNDIAFDWYKAAETSMQESLKCKPNALVYYKLGNIYREIGNSYGHKYIANVDANEDSDQNLILAIQNFSDSQKSIVKAKTTWGVPNKGMENHLKDSKEAFQAFLKNISKENLDSIIKKHYNTIKYYAPYALVGVGFFAVYSTRQSIANFVDNIVENIPYKAGGR